MGSYKDARAVVFGNAVSLEDRPERRICMNKAQIAWGVHEEKGSWPV